MTTFPGLSERALPLLVMAVAIVCVPVMILSPQGLPRLRSLSEELSDVQRENQELRRQIGKLEVKVRQLRDEPAAVERIARDELGLVRKSEVVFQFARAR